MVLGSLLTLFQAVYSPHTISFWYIYYQFPSLCRLVINSLFLVFFSHLIYCEFILRIITKQQNTHASSVFISVP